MIPSSTTLLVEAATLRQFPLTKSWHPMDSRTVPPWSMGRKVCLNRKTDVGGTIQANIELLEDS